MAGPRPRRARKVISGQSKGRSRPQDDGRPHLVGEVVTDIPVRRAKAWEECHKAAHEFAAVLGWNYRPNASWGPERLLGFNGYLRSNIPASVGMADVWYILFDHPFRFVDVRRPVGLVCHVYGWPKNRELGRRWALSHGLDLRELKPRWCWWNPPTATPLLWMGTARTDRVPSGASLD